MTDDDSWDERVRWELESPGWKTCDLCGIPLNENETLTWEKTPTGEILCLECFTGLKDSENESGT
jgi:hypothetical protein